MIRETEAAVSGRMGVWLIRSGIVPWLIALGWLACGFVLGGLV